MIWNDILPILRSLSAATSHPVANFNFWKFWNWCLSYSESLPKIILFLSSSSHSKYFRINSRTVEVEGRSFQSESSSRGVTLKCWTEDLTISAPPPTPSPVRRSRCAGHYSSVSFINRHFPHLQQDVVIVLLCVSFSAIGSCLDTFERGDSKVLLRTSFFFFWFILSQQVIQNTQLNCWRWKTEFLHMSNILYVVSCETM